MKFLKRSIALLLLAALLSTASCTSDTPASDNAETTSAPMTEAVETAEAATQDVTPVETNAIGTGIGVNPGRVTWAYDKDAFTWNGSGYWWLERNFDADAVKTMLVDSLCKLAGKDDVNSALDALFAAHNERVNGHNSRYKSGEKLVIKVNLNVTSNFDSSKTDIGGYYPSPVTMRSLLEILVAYGIAPEDISVIDPSRTFPTYVKEMLSVGDLKGITFIGLHEKTEADTTRPIVWSYDFGQDNLPVYNGIPTDNTSFWPKCVTEADYMINLFNLRGHSLAGFTASGKNHFGTLMPSLQTADGEHTFPDAFRLQPPVYSGIHHYVSALDFYLDPPELWDLPPRDMGTYSVLVDLLSNADAGGKTMLYLCDGLAATVNQGVDLTLKERWLSAPFGDGTKNGAGWTNTLLMSQDPVAIDSVAYDFLQAEKDACEAVGDDRWSAVFPDGHTAENGLIEAALAHDPPSGVEYKDGYGNKLESLGVHEHWNNADDKQYSRNLGASEGIELVQIMYD